MSQYPYNKKLSPPCPGLEIIFSPFSKLRFYLKIWAKIDTGADVTLIPQTILGRIGKVKQPTKCYNIIGFDGVPQKRPVYEVNFEVAGCKFEKMEVMSSPGNNILLGRDILNQWKLTLDGHNLTFKIEK